MRKPEGKEHLGDLGVDRSKMLKWMLEEYRCEGVK
jgi:hypothetical protein